MAIGDLLNKAATTNSSAVNQYQTQGGVQSSWQSSTDTSNSIFDNFKNEFTDWINDEDKICEDENNDGILDWKEIAESFGKGLCGVVKTAVKHPIATGLTVAGGIALTVATGGAAAPVLCAAGATIGAGTIAYGGYKAATAETDAEAKQAWETIGNGVFGLAASGLSAKSALDSAAKAGIVVDKADDINALQACFKATPEAIGTSAKNLFNNTRNILNPGIVNINGSKTLVNGDEVQAATDGIKVLTQDFDNISMHKNTVEVKNVPTSSVNTAISGSSLNDTASAKIINSLNQFTETTMQDWGTWGSLGDMTFTNGSNRIQISNAIGSAEALGLVSQDVSTSSKLFASLIGAEIAMMKKDEE